MHIDKYESAFLGLAGTMMLIFAGAVIISVTGLGIHLPHEGGQIAPAAVAGDLHFSDPGLREVRAGVYDAYIVAGPAWQFNPKTLTIPKGSTVTFYLTSRDVTHGFLVQNTTINMMIIPGQVSQVTYTFDKPGTYLFVCHEYCGALHSQMSGSIVVTEKP